MGQQPFETVVTTHGATVLRVCRAVLAGTEAWLVTIAHRRAIDVTRARARLATRRTAA